MDKQFSFNSTIKNVQNSLIANNIRDVSNFELLRSEEAVNAVIKSYTSRFKTIGGMLTDVSKFIVNSKDIVKLEDFNDLFESIYIDLKALYSDINIISKVLSLNLERNKNYFSVMKKRVKDLWNKLNLSRTYIYDKSPSNESYYESFSSDINASKVSNLRIDKKNGYLTLDTKKHEVHNKSYVIKSVTSKTYPEKNDYGNILHTTNPLNTFEKNYKIDGNRDMLYNGLWKEEIISQDVPDIRLNISSDSNPIYRSYKGIVSIVDIEYTYPVEINRLDVDVFGDEELNIDGVLYKRYDSDDWNMANFEIADNLSSVSHNTDFLTYSVHNRGFDLVSIYNISKITAKKIRIIFNKENYKFLESSNFESNIENKILNDLNERRYEVVKFGSNLNDNLSSPINDENTSLYNEIIKIIESTMSIQNILDEISELLIPQVDFVKKSFTNSFKFEIGAWSIDPINEIYTSDIGVLDSFKYTLDDKAITSVSLNTKQSLYGPSTINWYVNVNKKDVPIVENNEFIRKEPINPIDLSKYEHYKDWNKGTFVILDFPIDVTISQSLGLYTNGEYSSLADDNITFLNSRLLYFKDISDIDRTDYVIRYGCSIYKCVNLYSLSLKSSSPLASINKIPFGIVSARRSPLESFISDVGYNSNNNRKLSEDFMVTNAICTIDESQDFFGTDFSSCIFIANEILSLIDTDNKYSKYSNAINNQNTKLGSSITNSDNYYLGSTTGYDDLSLTSSLINLAPLPILREI